MSILTLVKTGRLGKRARRVVQLQRSYGHMRVGYAILRRVCDLPVLRHGMHVCAVDFWHLPLPKPAPTPRPSSVYTVQRVGDDQSLELAEYFGDAPRIEQRLAAGDHCFAAFSQSVMGAAVWLAIGPSRFIEDWGELKINFRFPAGIAWTFDGKGTKLGAWGTMMKQLPKLLENNGVEEVNTIIDCNNWQSMDAHRSLGYESAGVLLHVRLLGISIRCYKPRGKWWRPIPKAIGNVELVTRRRSL